MEITLAKYISVYSGTLKQSMYDYGITEQEFIKSQLNIYENLLLDLEDYKSGNDPFTKRRLEGEPIPEKWINSLSEGKTLEKTISTTKAIIDFLKEKEKGENKQKRKKPKKELTFKGLFYDPENAQKVKDILEKNHYTKNGKWNANRETHLTHKGNHSEFTAVYFALIDLNILKIKKPTTVGRTFCNEFGLEVPERTLRERPNNDYTNHFINLFRSIS
jgi:hypothetical protein